MDEKTKIRSYDQFKAAQGKTKNYRQLAELHQNYPELYKSYQERMEKEKLKESNGLEYYLKYGGNPRVEL